MDLRRHRKTPLVWGIKAAQGFPRCHDPLGPPSSQQVPDIPEGGPIYQLSGISAL